MEEGLTCLVTVSSVEKGRRMRLYFVATREPVRVQLTLRGAHCRGSEILKDPIPAKTREGRFKRRRRGATFILERRSNGGSEGGPDGLGGIRGKEGSRSVDVFQGQPLNVLKNHSESENQ